MRDLGNLGESIFQVWCSQVGLIYNGARIDRTGWDFLVESSRNYRDMNGAVHASPIEYRVQVKSTDKRNRKLAIPLSNLWRMAALQMPAFYVFIEFDGKNEAQRAYIVHVDSELVGRVLKRLHKNDQKEKPSALNKMTLTVHYGDECKLDELSGQSLLHGLNSPLGDDMAKYIAEKKQYLESVGYNEKSYKMGFNLDLSELPKLVDASLGIEGYARVSSIKGTHSRFGIPFKEPIFEHDSGSLTIEARASTRGMIHFKEDLFSKGLSFDINLYRPFTSDLPDELKKLRIEGELFDLYWYTSLSKSDYLIKLGRYQFADIGELNKILELSLFLNTPGSLVLELDLEDIGDRIFSTGVRHKGDFGLEAELAASRDAISISRYFGFGGVLEVSLYQMFHGAEGYKTFLHLLRSVEEAGAAFRFETDMSYDIDMNKQTVIVTNSAVQIGAYFFGIIFSLTGEPKAVKGGRLRIDTSDVNKEREFVIHTETNIFCTELDSLMTEIADSYEVEGSVQAFVHNPLREIKE